jgi:uncharacterized protein (DUF2141 family)
MKSYVVLAFAVLAVAAAICPVRAILGDINGDGNVDIKDVGIVAKAFGTTPSDPRWNPAADLDGNGKIDTRDIAIVAANFGK